MLRSIAERQGDRARSPKSSAQKQNRPGKIGGLSGTVLDLLLPTVNPFLRIRSELGCAKSGPTFKSRLRGIFISAKHSLDTHLCQKVAWRFGRGGATAHGGDTSGVTEPTGAPSVWCFSTAGPPEPRRDLLAPEAPLTSDDRIFTSRSR